MNSSQVTLTVSDYNNYFKTLIDYDPVLQAARIEGEVTSCKYYQQGKQVYFTITDGQSYLNCVMYNAHSKKASELLIVGNKIIVQGRCNLFKQKGTIIFQVSYALPFGLGTESVAFEALKKKLELEGLFNEDNKKKIPHYPEKVHIITSPKSAALADILHIFKRDYPLLSVLVIPSTMQGEKAPFDCCKALDYSNAIGCDLCLIARGGGSSEELATFNNESIVRAISNYSSPIISAIGHESDTTLSDYAADLRQPTPTAAAESITLPFKQFTTHLKSRFNHHKKSLLQNLSFCLKDTQNWESFAKSIITQKLQYRTSYVNQLLKRLEMNSPIMKLKHTENTRVPKIVLSIRSLSYHDDATIRANSEYVKREIEIRKDE